MDQVFLVIIIQDKENGDAEKIKLSQCFSYEFDEYRYLGNQDNKPVFFLDKKEGIDWINANIKNELNYYYKNSINKFLKTDDVTVEVPVKLLKHAIRDMFILQAIQPDLDYDYVDGLRPIQIANANVRIKNGDLADDYYQLCDLAGLPYTRD